MMFYDEVTLRTLFEDEGFIVKGIDFEQEEISVGKKLEPDMANFGFRISIHAQKPAS